MAYLYGQRSQHQLFPTSIDEYVGPDDPVRIYDAFIDALNFTDLWISLEPYKGGPDEYDPKTMLKIIVYGYANSIRTSRKLERACHRDISFVWLTGNLAPDYRTIARFRTDHTESIRLVLRETVRLCVKWNLIEGNALFVDSTAMEANAATRKSFTPENIQKRLAKIDEHIDRLLQETARMDQEQENLGSLVKVDEKLLNLQTIRAEVKEVEVQLKQESLKELNTTDRDCVRVKLSGRCRAGYKAQSVVDDKHGLIVSTEVVASANDTDQLSRQINNAQAVLERKPKTVVCDSGYAGIDDAAKIDQNITVVMPSQQQVKKERSKDKLPAGQDFTKDKFHYDATTDSYTCPAGQKLPYRCGWTRETGQKLKTYRAGTGVCKACEYFHRCTNNSQGRKISRHVLEHVRERIDAAYLSPPGQEIYKRRKIRCELPHAQIKHNGGVRRFLLRGLKGVNVEFSLLALAHNVTRIITILGAEGLLAKLKPI